LLWEAASVSATIVNWGGDDVVSQRQIMEHVSEITGVPVAFEETTVNRTSQAFDNTRRIELVGRCEVGWREGVRRTIETWFPGAVKST
jgi:hypothetical protein